MALDNVLASLFHGHGLPFSCLEIVICLDLTCFVCRLRSVVNGGYDAMIT